MKPTYQTSRPARSVESQRPLGHSINKTPQTAWSFQSGADLSPAGASVAAAATHVPRGLYALTQGFYDAQTKWEDRIEGLGLCIVIALASWPVMQAVYTAAHTV